MSFSQCDNSGESVQHVFGLVHSFRGTSPQKYPYLPVLGCDSLEEGMRVVDFHNLVKSSAYILPGVKPGHQLMHKTHGQYTISDDDNENDFCCCCSTNEFMDNVS